MPFPTPPPPRPARTSRHVLGWFLTLTGVAGLLFFYLFLDFRGLTSAEGMEQAQLAREVAKGHGFTTKCLRPGLLIRAADPSSPSSPDLHRLPDSSHAPLPIWIQAAAFSLFPAHWSFPDGSSIYFLDLVTAALGSLLFLASVTFTYLLVARIFDPKLAAVTAVIFLFCDLCWDLARSGLPHMLMLLLFTAALYTLFRAVEARTQNLPSLPWLAATSAALATLTLTSGISACIFLGLLAYSLATFPKKATVAATMIAVFAAFTLPWLLHAASRAPIFDSAKIHLYAGGDPTNIAVLMRSYEADPGPFHLNSLFRTTSLNAVNQIGSLLPYFGGMFLAPVFFLSLLHPFRRPEIRAFRWPLLSAWTGALAGMSLFGLPGGTTDPHQLHILFAPIMTAYGLAFICASWSRLQSPNPNLSSPSLANLHLVAILALAIAPFAITVYPKTRAGIATKNSRAVWPPYIPQRFHTVTRITDPNEPVFTDAPWAMAWYGDRTSIWLPKTRAQFDALDSLARSQGNPPAGVLLTPLSTDLKLSSQILGGHFSDWADLIPRGGLAQFKVDTMADTNFPFTIPHQLYPNNEIIFYADRPRFQRLASSP